MQEKQLNTLFMFKTVALMNNSLPEILYENKQPKKIGRSHLPSFATSPSLSFRSQSTNKMILLMEDILHQLIKIADPPYLQGFMNPRWCRIYHIVHLKSLCFAEQNPKNQTSPRKNHLFMKGLPTTFGLWGLLNTHVL